MGQRIGWLVRRRLEAWAEHQEAIRRGVSLLSLPNNAGRALRATWRTVDTLWYAAGDVSADFSYYTRRATLSAIYTATLLCWLDDKSEGFADSWDFLQRRLNDARQLPTLRRQVEQQLAGLTFPLNGLKGSLFKTRSRLKFGVKR